jgi:UDP-N-acetylglucosamine--N-acetylmuramyl-(pentapeptide) pyrophosphoryl-undecaprenol N-acetylglucosamine transferase
VECPAILVPLPTAAEDHQTHNARALTDRGAAVLLRDGDAMEMLGAKVLELLRDEAALDRLRRAIAGTGVHHAAEAIAAEVIRLGRREHSTRSNAA